MNICPGCGLDFGHCTDAVDLQIRASTSSVSKLVETHATAGDKWSESLESYMLGRSVAGVLAKKYKGLSAIPAAL